MIQYLIGNAEQISFSDAVSPRDEDEPSFSEYFEAEDAMLRFVESLRLAVGSQEILVHEPLLGIPKPSWLPDFRNGVALSPDQALRLLRSSLRGVPIGCTLSCLGDGSVLIGTDFDGLLRVDIDDRHEPLVLSLLPQELRVAVRQPTPPQPDVKNEAADDHFWQSVSNLLPAHPGGLLVIERWAYGTWGDSWYLATGETIDRIRRSIREHSQVIVQELPEFENIILSERFDETSVLAIDEIDLRYLPSTSHGLDLGIQPLTSAVVAADPEMWNRPVRIVSFPYSSRTILLIAVVPDSVTGTVTADWPT
ncbi:MULTISPECIES: hypothetical protein [Kitasatospora]|uniref:Uncharacterized protein n=1 Tax=Kitasatospora cystarginea TaxID=58350 RepID=A0ABN3ENY7_9ACTN